MRSFCSLTSSEEGVGGWFLFLIRAFWWCRACKECTVCLCSKDLAREPIKWKLRLVKLTAWCGPLSYFHAANNALLVTNIYWNFSRLKGGYQCSPTTVQLSTTRSSLFLEGLSPEKHRWQLHPAAMCSMSSIQRMKFGISPFQKGRSLFLGLGESALIPAI